MLPRDLLAKKINVTQQMQYYCFQKIPDPSNNLKTLKSNKTTKSLQPSPQKKQQSKRHNKLQQSIDITIIKPTNKKKSRFQIYYKNREWQLTKKREFVVRTNLCSQYLRERLKWVCWCDTHNQSSPLKKEKICNVWKVVNKWNLLNDSWE